MTSIRNSIDSTSTRIRPQDQQEQQYNPEGDYYYNNYTTQGRACSDVELPGAEIMQMIAEEYKDNVSQWITGVAASIIEEALRKGMEPKTVILAIRETGMAPRPSPYYLAAVLRRWAETGVVVSRAQGGADISTTKARKWWR